MYYYPPFHVNQDVYIRKGTAKGGTGNEKFHVLDYYWNESECVESRPQGWVFMITNKRLTTEVHQSELSLIASDLN